MKIRDNRNLWKLGRNHPAWESLQLRNRFLPVAARMAGIHHSGVHPAHAASL